MPELSSAYLIETLELQNHSHIVLALSGGLDSMVLLDLLCNAQQMQPFTLEAVYIHHGISDNASAWGELCAAQCAMRKVRFSMRHLQLSGRDNLEQRAREGRYQALNEFVHTEKHTLVTAHHGDDQLESLFLALKRGAGAAGLSGIASSRPFAQGKLMRPLLAFSRSELEHYALQQQLSYVEDESNQDTRFERNFIRQHITPVIRQRWPHFSRTAARSILHLTQLQQLAEHYTERAFEQCVSDNHLVLSALAKELPLQQDLVIRHWLAHAGLNPSLEWLDTLKCQVIGARPDATPTLQLAEYQVRRFDGKLYLLTHKDTLVPSQEIHWRGQNTVLLPEHCGSLQFLTQQASSALPIAASSGQIIFGQLSLRFKPAGALMSKPLKQWFKLWQVPPWQRLRTPLLLVDGELVAVAGYASCITAEQATQWISWQS